MKILDAAQIREIDRKTVKYEGITSLQLMEKAAVAFCRWFQSTFPFPQKDILIVCGTGNNGGDGLAVARILHTAGYKVSVWMVVHGSSFSDDCRSNYEAVTHLNIPVCVVDDENHIPDIQRGTILIDAIFGTGLSRNPDERTRKIISMLNASQNRIVSIDVPSGLFLNKKTDFAIHATDTVTFEIPKLALLLPENYDFVGKLHIIPIGLHPQAIDEATGDSFYTEKEDIRSLIKPLSPFAHKGTHGHAVIIGGSLGKMGAVCLAAKAALKSGAGLVTAYIPQCGTPILQTHFPEAMVQEDKAATSISDIELKMLPDAVGLGVGMGTSEVTQQALHTFLLQCKRPLVVDADALNILSVHQEWLNLLPPQSILTPHPKELERLIGKWEDDFDKLGKVKNFSNSRNVIVVIKGAYSTIVYGNRIYVNPTGTAALATAGSGDVLTGIITGLVAQGYAPLDAAKVGVYLHGLTANITEKTIHPRSFVASDIIENIGKAYFEIEK